MPLICQAPLLGRGLELCELLRVCIALGVKLLERIECR